MEQNGVIERLLVTDNTKMAAVLLTFGAHLRRHQPLNWTNEFESKEAFLAYRRNPQNTKPRMTVSFNFEPDGVDAKAVIGAYEGSGAEDIFNGAISALGLDPGKVERLLALHSKAVVQACREALDAREYLIKEHMSKYPESAKVIRVKGKGKGQSAMFGAQASKETIAEQLSKIS